jgi:hypothetical protein
MDSESPEPLAGCLATFWRKIAGGAAAGGIAMFAENCKVGRICN